MFPTQKACDVEKVYMACLSYFSSAKALLWYKDCLSRYGIPIIKKK